MIRFLLLAAFVGLTGCRATAPVASSAPPSPSPAPADNRVPDAPLQAQLRSDATLQRIGFGSCAGQDAPQPIWKAVLDADPDLFLLIGDNIYADTEDPAVMRAKYEQFDTVQAFRQLRARVPVLATWDDHDYGKNDAGAEYPMKEAAQDEFVRFFDPPADSRVRTGEGVYDAYTFGPEGRRVQVILLDTRYFRGPITRKPEGSTAPGRYVATDDTTVTMLGEAQWAWLESQLRQPADLRLIASSIQFVSDEHGWEGWGLMPHEQRRMLRLIDATNASGVFFISGDRHLADISKMPPVDARLDYPIFDVTSSSINRPSRATFAESNRYRVEGPFMPVNFGLITIDWEASDPAIRFEVRDIEGMPVLRAETTLETLR